MVEIVKDMVMFPGKKDPNQAIKRMFDKCMEEFAGEIVVKGLDNIPQEGGFLLVSNHQSHADGPFIWKTIWPRRDDVWAVAGKVIADSEVRNIYLGSYPGLIYFERREETDMKTAAKIIETALASEVELLSSGVPVFVFFEGTRSRTGELIQAKWRTILPAILANIPVVPCGIVGTDKILTYDESFVTKEALANIVSYVHPVDKLSITFAEPIKLSEVIPIEDNERPEQYAKRCIDIVALEVANILPSHKRGYYKETAES